MTNAIEIALKAAGIFVVAYPVIMLAVLGMARVAKRERDAENYAGTV